MITPAGSGKLLTSPLLAEPTEAQAHLLAIIHRAYCRYGHWPIFQYTEALLYKEHGLDARTVLLECPTVTFPNNPSRYGWFWSSEGRVNSIQSEHRLALTVAGMTRIPGARTQVRLFLAVLAYLTGRERLFTPSPDEVQVVQVLSREFSRDLPEWRWLLTPEALDRIAEQLGHEPSTWHSRPHSARPGVWDSTLSPFLRYFAGVADPWDYVQRVTEWVNPSRSEQPAGPVSSLALPEAIDYLNAVWRLTVSKPLFRITRAESVAKLSQPCATADEFDSRLSALCSILDNLQLPNADGNQKLSDLKAYLGEHLSGDSASRVENAVDDLRALFGLRAWRQHPGADQRGVMAMKRLAVTLPAADWGTAWRQVQARAVTALVSLREEIDSGLVAAVT